MSDKIKVTVKFDYGLLFVTLLTILIIGLKLTHQIDWSWWWVLSPMWIGVALTSTVLFILLIISISK